MVQKNSKIFIAGHKGLVGSAIIRKLRSKGYNNLITMARAANDDKKEVCKCIGDKMFNHVNKYTINGSSNDAINIKDKLNIETCN